MHVSVEVGVSVEAMIEGWVLLAWINVCHHVVHWCKSIKSVNSPGESKNSQKYDIVHGRLRLDIQISYPPLLVP